MKLLVFLLITSFSFSASAILGCPKISGKYVCENSADEKYPLVVVASKLSEDSLIYTFMSGAEIRRFITGGTANLLSTGDSTGYTKVINKSICMLGNLAVASKEFTSNNIDFKRITGRKDLQTVMFVRNGRLLARTEGFQYSLNDRDEWQKKEVNFTEQCKLVNQ